MIFSFEERPSDSSFVERIWRTQSERAGAFTSLAASHWEMVVMRHNGKMTLTVRGPETKATPAYCSVQAEMNSLPKYVVSTTLEEAEWNNSRLIKTHIAEEIARLKQESGQDILVFGSGTLAQTLLQHNLIDQYNLLVYPVVLGSGKRLFGDGSNVALKLVETKMFSSGVVALTYQPAQRA